MEEEPFFEKKKSLAKLIYELGENANNKTILDRISSESEDISIHSECFFHIKDLMEREGLLEYKNGVYFLTKIGEKYLNR